MSKKNKMLTTLFLSPLAWQSAKADSFFDEMMRMQENMLHRMQQEIQDLNDLFSKTFPQDSQNKSMDTQNPEIKISSHEDKETYIVTLNFEHASLKESSCDVEFEQTPQGQNLLRVLWKIKQTEDQATQNKTQTHDTTTQSSRFISASQYSSDKKTYSAYTNENGNISVTTTYLLPHSVSITDPIIKTDYETNSVEINLVKHETVKKYSISK